MLLSGETLKAFSQSRVWVSRRCVVVVIVHTLAGWPEHVLLSICREIVQRRETGKIRRKKRLHGKASAGHQLGAGARTFVFLSLIPTLSKTLSYFRLYKISCLFPWLNPAWLLHCWVKQCPFQRPVSSWRDQYSCLALGFAGSAPAPGHLPSLPLAGTGMTRVSTVLGGMFRRCVSLWEQLTSQILSNSQVFVEPDWLPVGPFRICCWPPLKEPDRLQSHSWVALLLISLGNDSSGTQDLRACCLQNSCLSAKSSGRDNGRWSTTPGRIV